MSFPSPPVTISEEPPSPPKNWSLPSPRSTVEVIMFGVIASISPLPKTMSSPAPALTVPDARLSPASIFSSPSPPLIVMLFPPSKPSYLLLPGPPLRITVYISEFAAKFSPAMKRSSPSPPFNVVVPMEPVYAPSKVMVSSPRPP